MQIGVCIYKKSVVEVLFYKYQFYFVKFPPWHLVNACDKIKALTRETFCLKYTTHKRGWYGIVLKINSKKLHQGEFFPFLFLFDTL